jgi:exopolysaccharide biosynthesis polyprenyl glycosylphosphotransferase
MLKEKARVFSAGLLLVELGLWAAWFMVAYGLRAGLGDSYGFISPASAYAPLLALAGILWVLWSLGGDPFRSQRTRSLGYELRSLIAGLALVGLSTMALIFLLKFEANSRLFLGFWLAGAALSILGLRVGLRSGLRWVRTRGYNTRKLAIVGYSETGRQVARRVEAHRAWGLQFVGFVVTPGCKASSDDRVLGPIEDLARILDTNVIDEVVFTVDGPQLEPFERAFELCEEAGVSTRILLDFFPHKISRLQLDDLDGFPMLAFHATRDTELALVFKRLFDLAVSTPALVLGAPVFFAVALAVKLTSPGPIFFVQRRVGLNGREFNFFKFRSMVVDAEARQRELLAANEMSGPVFKMTNDPRVTRVGRFLRKTSLDEIPQFFNVFRGDMSIVGPRPPIPSEVSRYERWQRRRLSVKPGITCTWQISGRNEVDFATWMRQDLAYIDNWSLWLDLKIFLLTIPAVLFARGAR